ncbi:MAG: hypothetical protein QM714_01895 [Nocardioides sp.]|uniref:hypothetical protein n=1 Tax=Nocardioides sp. TaxID=35761 RepID=UPI0039E23974
MPLVIWKVPHPLRGLVVFLVIFAVGLALGGFGMGAPELLLLTFLAGAAGYAAATRSARWRDDRYHDAYLYSVLRGD